jgi:hypothetical protein
MKWWNEWTRKHEGWTERRRRVQRLFAEGIGQVTGDREPALVPVSVPVTPPAVPNRGEE